MMVPIDATTTPAWRSRLVESLERSSGDRAEDFVIVAAGYQSPDPTMPRTSRSAAAQRQRTPGASIAARRRTPCRALRDRLRADPRHPSPRWHGRARRAPADGAAAARDSARGAPLCGGIMRQRRQQWLRLSARRDRARHPPMVPVTTTQSPGLRRCDGPSCRADPTERGDRDHQRTGCGHRIAAEQRQPKCAASSPKRLRERLSQAFVPTDEAPASARSLRAWPPWPRDRTGSPAAPCGPACRADHREEMHAFDHGVGRDHDVVAGGFQRRRIVVEAEGARIGRDRLEIARDEGVLRRIRISC